MLQTAIDQYGQWQSRQNMGLRFPHMVKMGLFPSNIVQKGTYSVHAVHVWCKPPPPLAVTPRLWHGGLG